MGLRGVGRRCAASPISDRRYVQKKCIHSLNLNVYNGNWLRVVSGACALVDECNNTLHPTVASLRNIGGSISTATSMCVASGMPGIQRRARPPDRSVVCQSQVFR